MSQGPQDDDIDQDEVDALLQEPDETADYVDGQGSEEEPE